MIVWPLMEIRPGSYGKKMNKIKLFNEVQGVKNILCLGAHCDDIEIGCGGTLLRVQEEHPQVKFHWVIFSSNEQRKAEAEACSREFIKNNSSLDLTVLTCRESYFPFIAVEIKERFDQLKQQFSPDLIFTHYHQDAHQDHRLISELTWNTYRNHLILEYMIPKYEGEPGYPNFFVTLSSEMVERKVNSVFNNYSSQQEKHWFTKETFLATMRLRGIESLAPSGYAEGFYARKMCY